MARLTVFRLVASAHLETAYAGIGAELHGGRFNSAGRRLVYTAGSISLALLEILVQANDRSRLLGRLCVPASFDDALLEVVASRDLPAGWDERPYTRVSQAIGDRWLTERRSAVLRVPSVVVPQEHNYLINPLHPDARLVEIGRAFPAPFDPRLLES